MPADPSPAPTQDVPLGRVGLWTSAFTGASVDALGDLAREVESLGYGAVWGGEVPGTRDTFLQSLLVLDATERLAVATGIANVHLREPSTAHAAARTVAARHPGRFVLGLGVSHAPLVEGMLGREYGRPLSTMRAYLDGYDASRLAAPEGRDPAPPVLLAALGPRMLELARDRTAGAHPYLVTPEHTRRARSILGPDRTLAVEQGVVLTGDRETGLRRARTHLERYRTLPNYRNAWLRLGYSEAEASGDLDDRLVEDLVVWGDEEAIAARIAEHHDAGADHVCLQVLGETPADPALDDVRRLGAVTG